MVNDIILEKAKANLKRLCRLKDFSKLSAEEVAQMKENMKIIAESNMTDEEICAFFDKADGRLSDHGTD